MLSVLLAVALLVSGGLTAVVFLQPSLVTVGFFFLILPGIILALAPTVFFYLLIFSIAWFALIRQPAPLGAGAGVVAVAAVALLLPEAMNQAAGRELENPGRRDIHEPGALARAWRTVALQPMGFSTRAACNDVCRLLLYNGEAERVIVLPPSGPPPARRRPPAPHPPVLFRIERAGSCLAEKELHRLDYGDRWLARSRPDDINKAVRWRAATGECLVMEPASGAVPDLTVRLIRQGVPASATRLRLSPAEVAATGIELIVGGRVVLRRLALRTAFFKRPLHLEPIENGLEMTGWRWGRRNYVSGQDIDVEEVLRDAAGFDLNPLSGASPQRLRAELNSALNHRELPAKDAAFLLVEDFLKELREEVSPDEAATLARIIRDPRFTTFGLLGESILKRQNAAAAAQDAMLDRLMALAREKGRRHYRQLEERIAALPPGAFRQPDPRVDALLSDDAVRADSPHLIVRLAERGPSAAAVLVGFMRARWSSKQTRFDRWDRDAEAALAGLCLLGDGARDSLHELRQFEQSGLVPDHLPATPIWRATLIALGASPDEFTPAGRDQPAAYRRRLVELSRRCPLP
jgi:hypothetical protein